MAIIKCAQGHFYDSTKYRKCPYCEKSDIMQDADKTIWQKTDDAGQMEQSQTIYEYTEGNGVTIGLYSSKKGNDYTVGWLVCTKGPDKGRDYRLHHGFNKIGRDFCNDIILANETMAARTAHCSIVYEEKNNLFYLYPEEGGITYFKGRLLEEPEGLVSHDCFEIGESTLEFIAFCEGGRKWER